MFDLCSRASVVYLPVVGRHKTCSRHITGHVDPLHVCQTRNPVACLVPLEGQGHQYPINSPAARPRHIVNDIDNREILSPPRLSVSCGHNCTTMCCPQWLPPDCSIFFLLIIAPHLKDKKRAL